MPTFDWSFFVREIEELLKRRNLQMTTLNTTVGAPSARDLKWQHIKWRAVKYHVRKLQLRIAKAIKHSRAKPNSLRRA